MKNNYSMNANKMIDQSLKNKISANDQKIQSLFKFKKNITKKINGKKNASQNHSKAKKTKKNSNLKISNRDLNSFRNNKENQKNLINLQLTPILKKENTNTSIISNNKKYTPFIQPSINNSNNTTIANTNKNTRKIKIKYKALENFINVKQSNNNMPNMFPKTKKVKNKAKSLTNRIDKNMSKSCISNLKCNSSQSLLRNKKSSKSFDFSITYERFIENESKKKEKISKIKKRREKFEKKIYPHMPKINQKSKSMTKSNTDDFLIRLEKYKKEQIEKEELLKRNILKDEQRKINRNNFLLIQKKLKRKKANNSVDKSYTNRSITECVNKLLEWGKKRKEKLEEEIKKQDLIEKKRHIPKINKIKKESKDNSTKKIYDRLYNKEKYLFGFKKEIYTQESTPKFRSKINKSNSQTNICFNLTKVISVYHNEVKEEIINRNEDDKKAINFTDRITLNDKYKYRKQNENIMPENKNKNLIVVIRKMKSQINNLSKNI